MIGTYNFPDEALEDFTAKAPEVVFLDIQMPRMNGLELASRMLSMNNKVNIVFLTAHSDYAVDAFKVEAVDYLLKPISKEDIFRVVKRLQKNSSKIIEDSMQMGYLSTPPAKCFGCFDVIDRNNNIIKWPTKKTEEAFAYLLFNKGNHVSKWTLIDILWPDMSEDKALNNLYSTIYRIKSVLKEISHNPQIEMINSGYILISNGVLSDMELFKMLISKDETINQGEVTSLEKIFFTYQNPLFGTKDYLWSIPYQEKFTSIYRKIYMRLLEYYHAQRDLEATICIIRCYVTNCIEEEEMIIKGIKALHAAGASQNQVNTLLEWMNKRLSEQDLPVLQMY